MQLLFRFSVSCLLFKEALAIRLIDCVIILLKLITPLCCVLALMAMSCYFRLWLRVKRRTLCVRVFASRNLML